MKKLLVLLLCLLCSASCSEAQNRARVFVRQIQFSPDGKKMAIGLDRTGSESKQVVRLWEVETGKLLWARDTGAAFYSGISFSPDGTLLAVNGNDKASDRGVNGLAGIWSVEKGELVQPLELAAKESIYNLTFTPDGKQLVGCVNRYDGSTRKGEIRLWNAATGKTERTIHTYDGTTYDLTISADGKRMMVQHSRNAMKLEYRENRGHLTLWELPEFKLVRTMATGQYSIRFPVLSPDGTVLAFEGAPVTEPNTVIVWDVNSPTLRPSELPDPMVERISSFRFTPDGKELVVTGEGFESPKQAKLWVIDVAKSRISRMLHTTSPVTPQGSSAYPLAISPDGQNLAIISGQSSIELRSVQDGKVIRKYE